MSAVPPSMTSLVQSPSVATIFIKLMSTFFAMPAPLPLSPSRRLRREGGACERACVANGALGRRECAAAREKAGGVKVGPGVRCELMLLALKVAAAA